MTPAPRRWRRAVGRALVALALLLAALALSAYAALRRSLPRLDGEVAGAGLSAPVTIERDGRGVPTLRGATRADVAFATGFVHTQDRFFQMDLLRRSAAGELAELVGAAALPADRRVRIHRLRSHAAEAVAALPAAKREVLEAYTAGVDAGLADLGARPFEYLLLRVAPRPWSLEDSFLVSAAMFLDLHDEDGSIESTRGLLHDLLPPALAEFLDARGSEWDAPLAGEPIPGPPPPGPEVLDLRRQRVAAAASKRPLAAVADERFEPLAAGSNNWAVGGGRTADGRALLADDMHLGLRVPNVWYHLSLRVADRRVTGASLPGTPAVVVGSTGAVAWGFTNTWADWHDLVVLEPAPGDADSYLTPEGPRRFARHREMLAVKGGGDREPEELEVLETIWGPVLDRDHRGRRRALRWVAYDAEATNLEILDLERAAGIEEAMAVAQRAGIPAQNFVVADAAGRIGWTVMGRVPRRRGCDGRVPASWADGRCGWEGWLAPAEVPRLVDPAEGLLWTANARVVGGAELERLGDGGYALGARARQIRDRLRALDGAREADLLAIQLDDRALFLERWRDLLLAALDAEAVAARQGRGELRAVVAGWEGRAAPQSAAYRAVRAFRRAAATVAFEPLVEPCAAADRRFDYFELRQIEAPLWRLVSERPPHLLDPRFADWRQALLAAADAALEELLAAGAPLSRRTWGERNTVRVRHPLSRALPAAARWLDMPPLQLPGDSHMPRFQSPVEGASQRLVVSPGREEDGVFHMPAGQSGHPLSPYYADGHHAWATGEPRPFLPGPTVHRLTLVPR